MTVSAGQLIAATDWNSLVSSINTELTRRGGGTAATTVSSGGSITAAQYNMMNTTLSHAASYPYSTGLSNVSTGQTITASQVVNLINAVNSASAVCLCNCNYCTCNCNYCTCNCNYCTCNCNYCTCNCNYACTCNCNYASDVRLKTGIELVGNEGGLNVYTWYYIWDKATKYMGVLAQELIGTKYESALSVDDKGFYMVNYSTLPVSMTQV